MLLTLLLLMLLSLQLLSLQLLLLQLLLLLLLLPLHHHAHLLLAIHRPAADVLAHWILRSGRLSCPHVAPCVRPLLLHLHVLLHVLVLLLHHVGLLLHGVHTLSLSLPLSLPLLALPLARRTYPYPYPSRPRPTRRHRRLLGRLFVAHRQSQLLQALLERLRVRVLGQRVCLVVQLVLESFGHVGKLLLPVRGGVRSPLLEQAHDAVDHATPGGRVFGRVPRLARLLAARCVRYLTIAAVATVATVAPSEVYHLLLLVQLLLLLLLLLLHLVLLLVERHLPGHGTHLLLTVGYPHTSTSTSTYPATSTSTYTR